MAESELWAVMTHGKKVMRVMSTERSAKVYATKRGLAIVGKMISRDEVALGQIKGGIWGGLTRSNHTQITRYGWVPLKNASFKVTVFRGVKAIEKHFGNLK